MNATTKGNLLIKSDRVNKRIDDFFDYTLTLDEVKKRGYITFDEFNDIRKSLHIIITTELNDKGVERQWAQSYTQLEKPKKESKEQSTHTFIDFFKRLMIRLHKKQ